MTRDHDRIARICQALDANGFDAVVCGMPANVLLLSGYWPVIGSTLAIATREGAVALIAPEDEAELAADGWADTIDTFEVGTLHRLMTVGDAVRRPLAAAKQRLGIRAGATVGFEGSGAFDPAGYLSTFVYGAGIAGVLQDAFPGAGLRDATDCLARLRSVLTGRELQRLRSACAIARTAYERTAAAIRVGMSEVEIATRLRNGLATDDPERCDGFAYCMSGPNSARAYAAFQRSRCRAVAQGDFVLLHCNSYCQGIWTDITRTFSIGPLSREQQAMQDAVMTARQHALAAIRPGARAATVDHAARAVLGARGFEHAFKHATGHGVGFAAINHEAVPRIHPASDEVLELGMVFNIEPAAYLPHIGGTRHCDVVVVTEHGVECLTPFQAEAEQLML